MGIPPIYRTGAEAVATYSYTDIAAGTGVINYYGTVSKDPTASYALIEQAEYSAQKETSQAVVGTTTCNFDLTAFNLPMTAKGTAIFSCALFNDNIAMDVKLTVQIQKSDGTAVSSAVDSETITTALTKMILVKLPLTETNFKKGEILRLVVQLVSSTGGTTVTAFSHSPKNLNCETYITSSATISTILKLAMPYRLDL